MSLLDAKESKPLLGGPSFSLGHRMFRAAWGVTWLLLAAWTPAPLHGWRVWLLKCFGARMHPTAHVYGSARVWYPPNLIMEEGACLGPRVNCYCMAPISLGRGVIVSQGAYLCAGMHDIEDPDFQLLVKPIVIGADAWVAAEAFVGPGVSIGRGAVLGARAVLFKDAVANGVYAGNPAQLIKSRKLTAQGNSHD
ncbi:MAG: putative colanic acid biosynthesis acetyltransferase [Lysobacteraceae bacterium]|nr:MAG: putative colanic acid biosynthesis acetyltransferase [Xanthomonadaceae bacterium]